MIRGRQGTAHGSGQQHRALDLELVENRNQPNFRQTLARRRLSVAGQIDGKHPIARGGQRGDRADLLPVADEKLAP